MVTARAVLGGILLFLGREVNFLFAGGFAALFGFRMVSALPGDWPAWGDIAFIAGLGILAAGIALAQERVGYVLSGILVGSYYAVEYFAPGVPTLPIIPFVLGGMVGGLVMGFLTEWALMVISSVIGAVYVVDLFNISLEMKSWIGAALFLAGALTQVVLRRMQQK